MTVRKLHEDQKAIFSRIKEQWIKNGWDWNAQIGEAASRISTMIEPILQKEIQELKDTINIAIENAATYDFESSKATDGFKLYKRLKSIGATEETASFAIYAFLLSGTPDNGHRPSICINQLKQETEQ